MLPWLSLPVGQQLRRAASPRAILKHKAGAAVKLFCEEKVSNDLSDREVERHGALRLACEPEGRDTGLEKE